MLQKNEKKKKPTKREKKKSIVNRYLVLVLPKSSSSVSKVPLESNRILHVWGIDLHKKPFTL